MSSLSYVHGASASPFLPYTVGEQLDRTAAAFGDQDALLVRQQGVRWTWRDLKRRADVLAAGLLASGLSPGDRIGIWSPNNSEWVLLQFAAAKAGLVLVNVNPAYREAELKYALNKVGCRALVMAASYKSTDYVSILAGLAPELALRPPGCTLRSGHLPALEFVFILGSCAVAGCTPFGTIASLATESGLRLLADVSAQVQCDDPVNIQFTSGTTGAPKAATLSHHNIVNNGFFIGEQMRLTDSDRLCIPVPLYHCFGNVLGNMACLTHGTTMVFPGEGFDPLAVLEAVQAEKCTALYGVPTMFIAELEHPAFDKYDLSSLRTGMMAGSPCPIEVMYRVIDRMHLPEITIAYGMTETSPASFQCEIDDPIERRTSTVGRILPHMEAKVIDTEGHIVARGEQGELCTRGYAVMLGYWGDADKTREAIDDARWMHTGDLATIDEDGFCRIVGRLKDMVIRGGENIYPREIEEYLYQHPAIQDVQIVGVPDLHLGEELCAWIQLREALNVNEADIRAFCIGKIAHFKIPKYIRFVDEFPMTIAGKIQKFVMREKMIEQLGLK
jgi:fatty-acyl-CoA synthase